MADNFNPFWNPISFICSQQHFLETGGAWNSRSKPIKPIKLNVLEFAAFDSLGKFFQLVKASFIGREPAARNPKSGSYRGHRPKPPEHAFLCFDVHVDGPAHDIARRPFLKTVLLFLQIGPGFVFRKPQ